MNKQPFYHDVQLLFTTTSGLSLSKSLKTKIRTLIVEEHPDVVEGTVEMMEEEPEAGDPADLM